MTNFLSSLVAAGSVLAMAIGSTGCGDPDLPAGTQGEVSTSGETGTTDDDAAQASTGSTGAADDESTSTADDSTTGGSTTSEDSTGADSTTGEGESVVHAEIYAQIHADDNPNHQGYRFLFGMMRDPAPEIEDEELWNLTIDEEVSVFTDDLDNLWRSGPVDYSDPERVFVGDGSDEVWASILEMARDDVDDVVLYGETLEDEFGVGVLYQFRRESSLYRSIPSLETVQWVLVDDPEYRGYQRVVVQLVGPE